MICDVGGFFFTTEHAHICGMWYVANVGIPEKAAWCLPMKFLTLGSTGVTLRPVSQLQENNNGFDIRSIIWKGGLHTNLRHATIVPCYTPPKRLISLKDGHFAT